MLGITRTLINRTLLVLFFLPVLLSTASAQVPTETRARTEMQQTETQPPAGLTSPVVAATAGNREVRYASLGEVHQTRLQVFTAEGTQVYDSEFKLGNLITWRLQDQQGQHLGDGTYLFLITVRDFSGRLTQKYGTAILEEEQVFLEQTNRQALPQAQNTTLEANRLSEGLSVVDRIGAAGPPLFTTAPVPLAATPVILTESNTPTNSQPSKSEVVSTNQVGLQNVSGTGNTNRLAKWTDNAGTLGDSALFETGGNVGIGTTAPGSRLHVIGTQGTAGAGSFQLDAPTLFANWTAAYPAFEVVNTNTANNNVSLFQFADAPSGASHAGIGAVSTSHANKFGDLFFYTKQADGYQIRMGVYGGNVGVGTTSPQAKLDVAGSARVGGDITVTGNAVVAGNIAAKYQDVAEWVESAEELTAGTVVSLDKLRSNAVTPSHRAYETQIAGVVSAQPGVILGVGGAGKVMVATTGRVKVKVDASRRPIKIGDLLVTSQREGIAMRSQPIKVGKSLLHRPGTIIGKALQPLSHGVGEILVLLSLQ